MEDLLNCMTYVYNIGIGRGGYMETGVSGVAQVFTGLSRGLRGERGVVSASFLF